MAVVQQAARRPDKHPWVAKLLHRMSAKQAAIAIANETEQIAWAIMVHGDEAGHRAPNWRHGCRAHEFDQDPTSEPHQGQQPMNMAASTGQTLMSQGKHNARDYPSPYSLHPAAIPTTLNYRLRQEGRSHMTPSIVGFDDLVNLLPRYDC